MTKYILVQWFLWQSIKVSNFLFDLYFGTLFFFGNRNSFGIFTGAICSGVAGYIGMYSATKANVRTAVAANEKGASEALNIAFFGGSIMGLTVASMGLLGIGVLFTFLLVM